MKAMLWRAAEVHLNRLLVLLLAWLGICTSSFAAGAPVLPWHGEDRLNLTSVIELAIVPKAQQPGSADWRSQSSLAKDDLTPEGTLLHFRAQLVNTTDRHALLWLQIDASTLDIVQLRLGTSRWLTGDHYPFDSRPIAHRSFVFPVSMTPGESVELSGWTDGFLPKLPVTLWRPSAFLESTQPIAVRDLAFFGFMTTLIAYCLMLYGATRVRAYLAFAVFSFFLSFFLFRLFGYGFQLLWPNSPHWNDAVSTFALYGLTFSFGWMTQQMLDSPKRPARFSRTMSFLLIALAVGGLVLALLGNRSRLLTFPLLWMLPALVVVVAMLVLEIRAGSLRAKLFALAWLPMLLASFWLALVGLGYQEYTQRMLTVSMGALALTAILLSFIISLYIRQSVLKRQALEREALEVSTRQAEQLERVVAERTAQLADSNRQLNQLALTDALTGLPNRRQLDDYGELHHRLARHTGEPLHVAILDLDHFKQVNDRFGHEVGDFILQASARVLRETVDSTGFSILAARLGGEELALVSYGINEDQLHPLLDLTRMAISEIREPQAPELRLTVSIGWTRADTAKPLSQAFRRADQALYRAKDQGRNQVLNAPLELAAG